MKERKQGLIQVWQIAKKYGDARTHLKSRQCEREKTRSDIGVADPQKVWRCEDASKEQTM